MPFSCSRCFLAASTVSLAPRPHPSPCTPSARCPACSIPAPCQTPRRPTPCAPPYALFAVGRLVDFMQVAAPRTTRRTASAAPPTPARRRDGGPWTTPTLHPSPTSLTPPLLHLHLLQPSPPSPRASRTPQQCARRVLHEWCHASCPCVVSAVTTSASTTRCLAHLAKTTRSKVSTLARSLRRAAQTARPPR